MTLVPPPPPGGVVLAAPVERVKVSSAKVAVPPPKIKVPKSFSDVEVTGTTYTANGGALRAEGEDGLSDMRDLFRHPTVMRHFCKKF